MPKVSIIIPVYQTKNYLNRCIGSIVSQKFSDFEIILVDDGSTDGSAEVCDRWTERDGRVRVIHKRNEGVSIARNVGIQEAKGKYIQFVDSDDWLEDDYTGELVRVAEKTNCELVLAGYSIHKHGGIDTIIADESIGSPEKLIPTTHIAIQFMKLYKGLLLNSPFNKLYKKTYMQDMFPDGVALGEDFIFNMGYLLNIRSISISLATGYCYNRLNENSATAKLGYYRDTDFLMFCKSAEKFLLKHLSSSEIKKDMDCFVYNQFCVYLIRLAMNMKISDACREMKSVMREPHVHAAVFDLDPAYTTMDKNCIRVLLKYRLIGCAILAIKIKNHCRGLSGRG